jgi:hypothetical protein
VTARSWGEKKLRVGTSKGSATFISTVDLDYLPSFSFTLNHGVDFSPSMSRSISSVVGSSLYRNTICFARLMLVSAHISSSCVRSSSQRCSVRLSLGSCADMRLVQKRCTLAKRHPHKINLAQHTRFRGSGTVIHPVHGRNGSRMHSDRDQLKQ